MVIIVVVLTIVYRTTNLGWEGHVKRWLCVCMVKLVNMNVHACHHSNLPLFFTVEKFIDWKASGHNLLWLGCYCWFEYKFMSDYCSTTFYQLYDGGDGWSWMTCDSMLYFWIHVLHLYAQLMVTSEIARYFRKQKKFRSAMFIMCWAVFPLGQTKVLKRKSRKRLK